MSFDEQFSFWRVTALTAGSVILYSYLIRNGSVHIQKFGLWIWAKVKRKAEAVYNWAMTFTERRKAERTRQTVLRMMRQMRSKDIYWKDR